TGPCAASTSGCSRASSATRCASPPAWPSATGHINPLIKQENEKNTTILHSDNRCCASVASTIHRSNHGNRCYPRHGRHRMATDVRGTRSPHDSWIGFLLWRDGSQEKCHIDHATKFYLYGINHTDLDCIWL